MRYPPNNSKELQRLLKRLGFEIVSYGRHIKFRHPTKQPINIRYRPYIVISHDRGDKNYSLVVIKELRKAYGFSEKEIKDAC